LNLIPRLCFSEIYSSAVAAALSAGKELCGRSPDYESIVFSRKPLFELRGGPIFFGFAVLLRLIFVFFSFRFLAINCSLDFILNNTVGNYSTATRASF
jgi:hypothetical protein